MPKKLLVLIAIILGLFLLVLGIFYLLTPAARLPSFLPGFDPTLTKIHYKHGLGAIILGLACFILAWFQWPKKNQMPVNEPASKQ